MENLPSKRDNKVIDIVDIVEEDVNIQQSPTPPGNNEKNPKPLKKLKPQKAGVDAKRHRKLTSDVWADFEFLDRDEEVCEGAYFHVRCCAHIMNLIVHDGLKEVDDAVIKARESVKYFKASQSRKKNFLNSVAHVELQAVRGLRQNMASRMYIKFEKYWDEFSTVMVVAAVLDPRYKFQIIEWGYEKVYGDKYESELVIMKQKLFSLFNEYVDESKLKNSKDGQPTNGSLNSQEGPEYAMESASLLMEFDKFSTKVTSQAVKSELECYLEEKLMPRVDNIDILDYWRTHEIRYPTVARMARDILAVPISTVASESAFSIGGRVLDAFRSSLRPANVEAIIWRSKNGSPAGGAMWSYHDRKYR